MPSTRKGRKKTEATFLEHIKSSLLQLNADIIIIKALLSGEKNADHLETKGQFLRPPPPPPRDIYDRNYLLAFREANVSCSDRTKHLLPRTCGHLEDGALLGAIRDSEGRCSPKPFEDPKNMAEVDKEFDKAGSYSSNWNLTAEEFVPCTLIIPPVVCGNSPGPEFWYSSGTLEEDDHSGMEASFIEAVATIGNHGQPDDGYESDTLAAPTQQVVTPEITRQDKRLQTVELTKQAPVHQVQTVEKIVEGTELRGGEEIVEMSMDDEVEGFRDMLRAFFEAHWGVGWHGTPRKLTDEANCLISAIHPQKFDLAVRGDPEKEALLARCRSWAAELRRHPNHDIAQIGNPLPP